MALAVQQARLHEQIQRHAAELEQRVAERTARLQEINDELESFSFSVSHDLRAPLRGMQGFANALLEDYLDQLDEEGQEYLQRIVTAGQRLDQLIQDLLAYSRLGRADLRLQPVELSAVLNDVLTQLETELQEKKAVVHVTEPLPMVTGHHSTLVQVLANLMSNAVKFVPAGTQPQIQVWTAERDGWIRLAVKDNGIGIDPEHHERIFRIFERLHGIEIYPGTGVGLAIVRKAIARMGGRVGLISAPGQGSEFWLELPKANGEL
jgi:signal transduction histidine kinase